MRKRPVRYLDNYKDEMDKFIESQINPNIKYIKSFFEDKGFVFKVCKEDSAFVVFKAFRVVGKELVLESCIRLRLFYEKGFGYWFTDFCPELIKDKDGYLFFNNSYKSESFRVSSTSNSDDFEKNFFTYLNCYDKYIIHKNRRIDMFYGEGVF